MVVSGLILTGETTPPVALCPSSASSGPFIASRGENCQLTFLQQLSRIRNLTLPWKTMSYVVHPSGKSRRGRRNDGYPGGDGRGKTKAKPKTQEAPVERETIARKVVIRNLPLNFTRELFLQHVSPLPEYTYFAFHGPDTTLANQARCRAYLRFRNEDDVAVFKEKFDGYIFMDSRGHELRCMVEMAPYQRTAIQNQEKSDLKCGDIVNTEEYKRFLEDLEKKKEHTVTSNSAKVQANLAALEKTNQTEPTLTPLMEYLQSNRAEEEENYRRSGGGGGGGSSRKERFRERPNRKSSGAGGGGSGGGGGGGFERADSFPQKPILIKQREDRGPPKPRGKDAPTSWDARPGSGKPDRGKKDDFPPSGQGAPPSRAPPANPLPESERGRHFFAERPFSKNPAGDSRTELPEKDRVGPAAPRGPKAGAPPGGGKYDSYTSRREESYRSHPAPPPKQRPLDRPRAGPNVGTGLDQSGREDRPPAAATVAPPKPKPVVRAPIENPITGIKEFAQVRQNESGMGGAGERATVDTSRAEAGAGAGAGEFGPDGVSRVPNRARPAIALYQPKGKRRYQN